MIFLSLGISSTPYRSLIPALFLFFVRAASLCRKSARSFSANWLNRSWRLSSLAFWSLREDLRELDILEYRDVLMTVPLSEGLALRDASLTSPALSPKMALRSFSSGEGSLSPLGVIFPIMMSPGSMWAPMRMIPSRSRLRVASSLTLGMSEVSSSMPLLVSRTSVRYSSTWIEVRMSHFTISSLRTMASS